MPSKFDELAAEFLEPHVDEHYGVPFKLVPMVRPPNGRPAPDPDRPVIEGVGVYGDAPVDVGIQMDDRRLNSTLNDMRSLRTANEPSLLVQMTFFPTPESRPRQGDVVELEYGRFDVVSAQPDGAGRIEMQLVRASEAAASNE